MWFPGRCEIILRDRWGHGVHIIGTPKGEKVEQKNDLKNNDYILSLRKDIHL